jgi:hypothetical protein
MKKNNTHNSLKKWAKKSQLFPIENKKIKNKILENFIPHKKVENKKIKIKLPRRFLFATLATSTLAVLIVIGSQFWSSNLQRATSPSLSYEENIFGTKMSEYPIHSIAPTPSPIYDTPYGENKITIDDNREFLKIGYRATVKTRNVNRIANRLQTLIRGYGGRIDGAYIDERSASISFVIPKSSFDQFSLELQDMIPSKFLKENINIKNLLSQKQNIENFTSRSTNNLDKFNNEKKELKYNHDEHIKNIQTQINNYYYQLSLLNNEVTTSTTRLKKIDIEKSRLNNNIWYVNQEIKKENTQFDKELAEYDKKIEYETKKLASLSEEDQNLTNKIETVEGHISIDWINLYELIDLYIPIYFSIGITTTILIIIFIFIRRRSIDDELL